LGFEFKWPEWLVCCAFTKLEEGFDWGLYVAAGPEGAIPPRREPFA